MWIRSKRVQKRKNDRRFLSYFEQMTEVSHRKKSRSQVSRKKAGCIGGDRGPRETLRRTAVCPPLLQTRCETQVEIHCCRLRLMVPCMLRLIGSWWRRTWVCMHRSRSPRCCNSFVGKSTSWFQSAISARRWKNSSDTSGSDSSRGFQFTGSKLTYLAKHSSERSGFYRRWRRSTD